MAGLIRQIWDFFFEGEVKPFKCKVCKKWKKKESKAKKVCKKCLDAMDD